MNWPHKKENERESLTESLEWILYFWQAEENSLDGISEEMNSSTIIVTWSNMRNLFSVVMLDPVEPCVNQI